MPDDRLKVALGQMRVGPRAEDNLRRCMALMRRAASEGARLIVLPEGVIARDPADPALCARRAERLDGPFVEGLLEASRGIPVAVACTVHVLPRDAGGKVSNVHLVAQGGKLLAAYRKLHLYDAFASRESDTVEAGREVPPLVEIDGWRLGLMTCYDLRFPELARRLALDGADALVVPAAWERGPLKESHWELMARARALENTVYVLAVSEVSAQNIGCSMAVDPLGVAVARAGGGSEAFLTAELSREALRQARLALPVLANRRFRAPELASGE